MARVASRNFPKLPVWRKTGTFCRGCRFAPGDALRALRVALWHGAVSDAVARGGSPSPRSCAYRHLEPMRSLADRAKQEVRPVAEPRLTQRRPCALPNAA